MTFLKKHLGYVIGAALLLLLVFAPLLAIPGLGILPGPTYSAGSMHLMAFTMLMVALALTYHLLFGVAAEIYPDCGKMKKQMEYANRRGIPYVVIVGSQELEAKAATVKDMRSGEQRQVPFGELTAYFK